MLQQLHNSAADLRHGHPALPSSIAASIGAGSLVLGTSVAAGGLAAAGAAPAIGDTIAPVSGLIDDSDSDEDAAPPVVLGVVDQQPPLGAGGPAAADAGSRIVTREPSQASIPDLGGIPTREPSEEASTPPLGASNAPAPALAQAPEDPPASTPWTLERPLAFPLSAAAVSGAPASGADERLQSLVGSTPEERLQVVLGTSAPAAGAAAPDLPRYGVDARQPEPLPTPKDSEGFDASGISSIPSIPVVEEVQAEDVPTVFRQSTERPADAPLPSVDLGASLPAPAPVTGGFFGDNSGDDPAEGAPPPRQPGVAAGAAAAAFQLGLAKSKFDRAMAAPAPPAAPAARTAGVEDPVEDMGVEDFSD